MRELGEEGATFYRYDGAGRIVAMVRHDGGLASFNAANLRAFDFAYGSVGELTSVTYPSGRVVTYGYVSDKVHATSVAAGTYGTVLDTATWDPDGELASWRWIGSSSRQRTVTRDYIGRITGIVRASASGSSPSSSRRNRRCTRKAHRRNSARTSSSSSRRRARCFSRSRGPRT